MAFRSWSMSLAERSYAVGNQKMLAIAMFCCHWHHYLEDAMHAVEVLTDYHNLLRFITTKLLTWG